MNNPLWECQIKIEHPIFGLIVIRLYNKLK